MVDLEGICLSLPVVLGRSSLLDRSRSRLVMLLGSRSRLGVLLGSRSCLVVVEHGWLSSRTLFSYCHDLPLGSRSSLYSRSSGSCGSST